MRIAPAGAASAEALAKLHEEAFARPWREDEFVRLLGLGAAFALIAEDEEGPAGFVLAWAPGGAAEILTLAVAPRARRCGLGAALTGAAMAQAAALGAAQISLEVSAENQAARALYARLGFVEKGRRRGYYAGAEGREDAIVLCAELGRDGER